MRPARTARSALLLLLLLVAALPAPSGCATRALWIIATEDEREGCRDCRAHRCRVHGHDDDDRLERIGIAAALTPVTLLFDVLTLPLQTFLEVPPFDDDDDEDDDDREEEEEDPFAAASARLRMEQERAWPRRR